MIKNKVLPILSLVLIIGLNCGYIGDLTYWQRYGPAKIIKQPKSNLEQSSKPPITSFKLATIVHTDTQAAHINAIKKILAKNPKFQNTTVNLISCDCPSEIAKQPLGLNNCMLGNINRINNAIRQFSKDYPENYPIYYIAIQEFFTEMQVEVPCGYILITLKTPENKFLNFVSDGIEVHPEIYENMLELEGLEEDGTGARITFGQALSAEFELDDTNWQNYVTQQKMNNEMQILSAFQAEENF